MKKKTFKKNCFNIRKGFCLTAAFVLYSAFVLLVSGLSPGQKVHASENLPPAANPLYKMSFEDYLKKEERDGGSYTWQYYSNTVGLTRPQRLAAFYDYYRTQLNTEVANQYGFPQVTHYQENEVTVPANQTSGLYGTYDLYLMEFSTANEVEKKNMDLYGSVYYVVKSGDNTYMRFTNAMKISQLSREFLGKDTGTTLRKGETEMCTIMLPKSAIPVGVFFWQGTGHYYPWELSYFNMYKVDSVSDVITGGGGTQNYRTFTGTLVGSIDAMSLSKEYMSKPAENAVIADRDFEWLYPLTPENLRMQGYVLEIVTKGPRPQKLDDQERSAVLSMEYELTNGKKETSQVIINSEMFAQSHPYIAPQDYDGTYDFEYGHFSYDEYVNPIAKNAFGFDIVDGWALNGIDKTEFANNNIPYVHDYEMQDEEFWVLPEKNNYNFTAMNRFAGLMLGNYFDAATMSYNYLNGYQAIQIPITLPANIKEFTKISTDIGALRDQFYREIIFAMYNRYPTDAEMEQIKKDPEYMALLEAYFEAYVGAAGEQFAEANKNVGIQSIRIIQLEEPLTSADFANLTTNGIFSNEAVLKLKGQVLAETRGEAKLSEVVTWFNEKDTPNAAYSLVNYTKGNRIRVNTVDAKFQGVTVTFSDTFGAGLDNLLADILTSVPEPYHDYQFTTQESMAYVFRDKNNPAGLGIPLYNLFSGYYRDPLTLTVTYYDSFDDVREVDIPFVTAYLMQLIMDSKTLGQGSDLISGILQQGQTAALRLNLSEFKSFISAKLHYGYDEKNPLTGKLQPMEGDAYYEDDDIERDPLLYNLAKDAIALDSISFYDNVTTDNFKMGYDGKGLIPTFKTSLKPSSTWTASTSTGQILTENRSFTVFKESREGSTVNMFDGYVPAKNYDDKYLVEISTLNTPIAGTISDLTYQLHYIDNSGEKRDTLTSSLQGAAKDFYGNSSRNLDATAADVQCAVQSIMHLTGGSKICFVVDLPNVKQFEGITLSTDGADEWQPEQIRILKLTSLSERTAKKDTVFAGNLSAMDVSDTLRSAIAKGLGIPTYRWDRTYTGDVLASATPNLLLHSGKTSARVNFTIHKTDGTTVAPDTEIEDVKYLEKIPNTMTYEDTLVDLGLNIVKNTYQVHVDVANVADAGSSNYFYFQLLFENGRSGLVLANQQLPSDSFRQGLTESFEIQTTQNYGEVKAVRIICEATASTASTFDKLNIDKITVTLNSKHGTGKSWIVDRVGWLDINYVDEIQQTYASDDNIVLENKDLTLDFPVTSISSSTDLLFCITNGKQSDDASSNLNMTSLGSNIEGIITYTDFQNTTRTVNINLPQKIMDFNENESTSRILRSGTIDRFVLSLSDVKQIDSFVITRNEGKNADWKISDITINKVGGVGDVYLSSYTGEYIRNIEHSEYLTSTTTKDVVLGLNDSKTFLFVPHEIEADISSEDNNAWNTTITRYPISSDESLNIYVYLSDANGKPYILSEGDNVDASIIYSSSMGTGALKASFKNIRAQSSTENASVLFAQGLSIQSVGSIKSMDIRGNFSGILKPIVRCVYIEHVQGNVIKDTLYVPFNNASLALDKVSANISSLEALTPMKQIVRLQPKEGTSALLTPESSDIAVALRYTSSLDPETTKMVYQSPYVFLTDADYTMLGNRDHIEVPFYINGLGEIVGLTVISSGPIVEFENALITNYPKPSTTDGKENEVTTLLGSCSIAEQFVSTNIISKMMKTSKDVTPVTFSFTTPKEELVAGGGTSGQVSMLITYTDSTNNQQTYRINNILDYLPLDNPPFPDTITSFNILLTDVAYLNSVTLTPSTDDWFLSEVNAKVTNYDGAKQTVVNKTAVVNQWAKADGPLTIDMRPDSVNTDGPIINKITGFSISASAVNSKVSASASAGNPLNIKVVAGDKIEFIPTFQKVGTPTANVNWSAYDYEDLLTDFNDGSAVFLVPDEQDIVNNNLPRQYTLSAVCSENNSLAVPITIDVVSPEDLENAKNSSVKLNLIALDSDNKTVSNGTYGENAELKLKVSADANGVVAAGTTFRFIASLDKDNALLSVHDSNGNVVTATDNNYILTVPEGTNTTNVSNYYLKFNVSDAQTETTYTVKASLVAQEQETPAPETPKMTVELIETEGDTNKTVASGTFEENSTLNNVTYIFGSANDVLSYRITAPANTTINAVSVKADASSYADEIVTTAITGASGNLIKLPTLDELNAKLADDKQIAYGSNNSVAVPFKFNVTITVPNGQVSPENPENTGNQPVQLTKTITGTINLTVLYTKPESTPSEGSGTATTSEPAATSSLTPASEPAATNGNTTTTESTAANGTTTPTALKSRTVFNTISGNTTPSAGVGDVLGQ